MLNFKIKTELLPHQKEAVAKLLLPRVGALFMEMGTGKTLTALELIRMRFSKVSKVIWICPTSLKTNTREQIRLHTDIPDEMVVTFDHRTTEASIPNAFVYIIGIQSIGQSTRELFAFRSLITNDAYVVVDESSFIKNSRAMTTKRIITATKDCKYKLILNGTPISQGIEDLYSQMYFLHPRILGFYSWRHFARKHLEYSDRFHGLIVSRTGKRELNLKMTPYVYHIKKSQCVSLPAKTYSSRYVDLTENQSYYYAKAKERFMDDVLACDGEESGIAIYTLFTSLLQISNGVIPKKLRDSTEIDNNKLKILHEIIQGVPDSHIVVWATYHRSIKDILASFKKQGIPQYAYYGNSNSHERDVSLESWKLHGGVLVATTACGGYGLTLNEANYSIFYSNSFKYSQRIQAEDRNHRIGKSGNCHYIDIWADCGIEERVRKSLLRKGNALLELKEDLERIKSNKGRLIKMMSGL